MPHFNDSQKYAPKEHNEDFSEVIENLAHGTLYVVLDFSNYDYPNFNRQLSKVLRDAVAALNAQPNLPPELFLGYVAQELNNYVFNFGRVHFKGSLLCVAAMCLLDRNRLTYLTYGDARINLYDPTRQPSRLLLLNGSKYLTPVVVDGVQDNPAGMDDNPQRFGRDYFDTPPAERARTITLEDGEVVLMFTDGVEEVLTPQRRLDELRRAKSADPRALVEALMQASGAAQDDRTLLAIAGPYGSYEDPRLSDLSARLAALQQDVAPLKTNDGSNAQQLSRISNDIEVVRAGYASLLKEHNKLVDLHNNLATGVELLREQTPRMGSIMDRETVNHLINHQVTERINSLTQSLNAQRGRGKAGRNSPGVGMDADTLHFMIDQWVTRHQDRLRQLLSGQTGAALRTTAEHQPSRPVVDGGRAGAERKGGPQAPVNDGREQPDSADDEAERKPGLTSAFFRSSEPGRPALWWVILLCLLLGGAAGLLLSRFITPTRPQEQWIIAIDSPLQRYRLIQKVGDDFTAELPIPSPHPIANEVIPRPFATFNEAQAELQRRLSAQGAAQTPGGSTAAEAQNQNTGPKMVTVQSGQNASIIARENAITLEQLQRLNPGVNIRNLGAGTQLKVSDGTAQGGQGSGNRR